jgi:hypothetical protein
VRCPKARRLAVHGFPLFGDQHTVADVTKRLNLRSIQVNLQLHQIRVDDLGFRVSGLDIGVSGAGFRVSGGTRILRLEGLGVSGLGFGGARRLAVA